MIAGYMRKPYGRWYDFFIYGKGGTAELITFGIFYEAPEYKSIYKYNDKEVSRREYISLTKDYLDYFDSMADLDWQWTHRVKQ